MVASRYPLLQYLAVEDKVVRYIKAVLRKSAADLARQISASGGKDPLTRAQLRAQQAAINAVLNQDWKKFAKAIDFGQEDAVAEAMRVLGEYEKPILHAFMSKADAADLIKSEAERAAAGTRALMDRLTKSYIPLSQSVYNSRALAKGMVDKVIDSALVRGLSARELAKEIRDLISPDVPGGVSYAALRLARTEINNAFHAGSIRRYLESGMVVGVEWHLSRSHPEEDECDDLAANSPYPIDDVPDKPHPQDLCFLTPAMPDLEGLLKAMQEDDEGPKAEALAEAARNAAIRKYGSAVWAKMRRQTATSRSLNLSSTVVLQTNLEFPAPVRDAILASAREAAEARQAAMPWATGSDRIAIQGSAGRLQLQPPPAPALPIDKALKVGPIGTTAFEIALLLVTVAAQRQMLDMELKVLRGELVPA